VSEAKTRGEVETAAPEPKTAPSRGAWLLALVPLVGLVELALHLKQTSSDVVPDSDWTAARDAVKADLRPDDLVVFAPFWADPLGRRWFGGGVATIAREARPDATRFPRAFEVSIRGAHDEELAGWKKVAEKQVGKITIAQLENPAPAKVLTDLVTLVRPDTLAVSRIDANGTSTACPFQRGVSSGGSTVVPQGTLTPADRFVCGAGHVGVAVLHALDHHPHLCIFASPQPNATLRLEFKGVTFGASLHGHSGIQWISERTPTAERVDLAFSAFERPIGSHSHKVGVGWAFYEFPTPELAGKKGDLVADITGAASQRYSCFEADTR
jgi:hypothetical protein